MTQFSAKFLKWHEELQDSAVRYGLQNLVSSDPAGHLASYNKGLNSEEELIELEELAQWNGCACGG